MTFLPELQDRPGLSQHEFLFILRIFTIGGVRCGEVIDRCDRARRRPSRGVTAADGRAAIGGANEWADQLKGPFGRAELVADKVRGALPARFGYGGIQKAVADERKQFFLIGHNDGRVAIQEGGYDVAKVAGVGPKRYRRAVGRRLDHVLPTAIAEASADERNPGRSPPGAEFADDVDQKH
jgi:hypothetical protein